VAQVEHAHAAPRDLVLVRGPMPRPVVPMALLAALSASTSLW
jgi:hypothetical protein